MDPRAEPRGEAAGGDEVEGALAALGGAGFLLPLSFGTFPAALAMLLPSALAGAILGSWKPRSLGPIAFGFGLAASVGGLLAADDVAGFLFWILLVPLLALPVGALLPLLGLATVPPPPPSVRRPAWAERPLGPEPGIGPLDPGPPPDIADVVFVPLGDRSIDPFR